jgi:hypothetical protein
VEDFEGLHDLMILEQLNNYVPAHVATCISEQKARNVRLADFFLCTK